MKAVILVGGEATRLRPLTCNTPKAMVPVLNTPFLEYVIGHLSSHQVRDIILAQGHLAQPIEGYLGDGSRFGVKLSYVVEDAPLGTGGAVKNAERYLDKTFLVINGDIFTDLDITTMTDFHREREAKLTIAGARVDDPSSYGLIETNAQSRIAHFLEKPKGNEITTNLINAGTYVMEPDVLAHIPPQTNFSFERRLFPLLLERGEPVYAYPSSAYWIDMGTPEKYLQLNCDLLNGTSNQYNLTSGAEVHIGKQTSIHPTVQTKGRVVIGDNCTIDRGVKLVGPVVIGSACQILPEAVIEESIIWHKVQIGQESRVRKSIIANDCCLGDRCLIEDSLLGDNVTLLSGCKLDPGSKIEPGKTVDT